MGPAHRASAATSESKTDASPGSGVSASSEAKEVIDARGLIVAPGFIDLHTHYDAQLFWDPWLTISGWHGVTSVVIGNCGFGFAPVKPGDEERAMLTMTRTEAIPLAAMKAAMPWDWDTYPEFLDRIERLPKGVNVLPYVPVNPLMGYVMGIEQSKTGRMPTDDEHAHDGPSAQRGDGRRRLRMVGAAPQARRAFSGAARLRRLADEHRRDARRDLQGLRESAR